MTEGEPIYAIFVTRDELRLLYWSLPEGCIAGRALLAEQWRNATAEDVPSDPYAAADCAGDAA